MSTIGVLFRLLKNKGATQVEIASKLGVTRQKVAKMMQTSDMKVSEFLILISEYNIDIQEFADTSWIDILSLPNYRQAYRRMKRLKYGGEDSETLKNRINDLELRLRDKQTIIDLLQSKIDLLQSKSE